MPAHSFKSVWTVAAEALSQLVPHANNVQIVGWIDRMAELHHDATGAPRAVMHAQGRMWFVARHEVDYLAEAFAGDRLGGATWVGSLGRTSLNRESVIWNLDTGRVICRAKSRWAHIDLATRRPSRAPHAERLALEPSSAPRPLSTKKPTKS